MDNFDVMLNKIHENPTKYIREKSLKLLVAYLDGYGHRYIVELWERETGLNYYEQFDEVRYSKLPKLTNDRGVLYEGLHEYIMFRTFVGDHYDMLITLGDGNMRGTATPLTATDIISRECNSEEEAFDKFFELYFAYRKKKEELGVETYMRQFNPDYPEYK